MGRSDRGGLIMKLWVPLIDLIKEERFKRVAEVGVYKGVSTRQILGSCSDILDEYWAIDPFMKYEQMNADWDALYRRVCAYMIEYPKLRALRLTSEESVKLFPKGYFDLVFIDANHHYDFIKQDLNLWKPLVRKGGILSGHDYKQGGQFPFWGVYTAVNEMFKPEEGVKI